MQFVIYEVSTGRIIANRSTSNPAQIEERYITAGLDWLPGHSEDHYVFGGALVARPTVPLPSATYDLTSLPAGTVVTVENEARETLEITDLTETLTLTDPGSYLFRVEPPFPYMPIKAVVEVA